MARKRWNCSNRKPRFFKVLLGDFHQHLRVPPAFVKHISKEASSSKTAATLEGPSGSIWHVELSKRMNDIFLQDGWQKFAHAHFLRESDFLVFRYNGALRFSVRIFDKTGCEREECFDSEVCEAPTFFPQRRRGQPQKKSLKFGHVISGEKARKMELKNHPSNCASAPKHSVGGTHMPSLKQEGTIETEEEDVDLLVHETGMNAGKVGRLVRSSCSVKSKEKAKVQERVNSFPSKFPFFAKHMGLHQLRTGLFVSVPAWFSRQHLPKKKLKIFLRDPNGKAWEVNLIWFAASDSCHLSGGWSAFSRGNNIKEGDICIFELVDKLEMHVHIFH